MAEFEASLVNLETLSQEHETLHQMYGYLRFRAQGGKGCGKARARLIRCRRRLQRLELEMESQLEEVLRKEDLIVQTLPHKKRSQLQTRVSQIYQSIDNARGVFSCSQF